MKPSKITNLIVSFPLILALSSCASIVSKSEYPVTFKSSNESAVKIEVRDKHNSLVHAGTTPTTSVLKAGGGFQSARYTVTTPNQTRNLNGGGDAWVVGNVVFGGLLGIVIDCVSGSAFKLPREFYVDGTQPATRKSRSAGRDISNLSRF